MTHPGLLFLDTETLGLDPAAPIWEIGAIRVWPGGFQRHLHVFVDHDPDSWLATMPQSFQDDYRDRYRVEDAYAPELAIRYLADLIGDDEPFVVGSNPSFDMQRLERLSSLVDGEPLAWHYHPIDMPTLAHGWLVGKGVSPAPPWKSDLISQMIGVDPADFDRHTALGDARWCQAMWRAVMS